MSMRPSFPIGFARVNLLSRVLGFGAVSALGLLIDCGLFAVLTIAGLPPLIANLVSAGLAVTVVFVLGVRHVFRYRGGAVLPRYLAYLTYQAVAVAVASVAIGLLAAATGWPALLCKLLVLPATFAANYVAMALLTREEEVRS